jgi:hypothetical protein
MSRGCSLNDSWAAHVTIQDLGSVGELVAAVATIATLGYLAVQLRQNTATVRTSTRASHTQATHTLNVLLVQEEENHIFWAGLADELDEDKFSRFEALLGILVQNYEQNWQFNKDGVIDASTWAGQLSSLERFAYEPGFRRWWANWGDQMNPDFASVVNEIMSRAPKDRQTVAPAVQQCAAADSP